MAIPYPKARVTDIDELALKAITVHKNDKSGGLYAKMKRHYGKKASDEALSRAYKVAKLLNMDTVPEARFKPIKTFKPVPAGTYTGRYKPCPRTIHQILQQPIQGNTADLIIIDELEYPPC